MPAKHDCPSGCGSTFRTSASLLKHMNSPWTHCANAFDLVSARPENSGDSNNLPNNADPVDFWSDIPVEDSMPVETPTISSEFYPGAARTFGPGLTFMDHFDKDEHAPRRVDDPYYPFASHQEWELASFLLRSHLSMASIDEFLRLTFIKSLGLSFHTAKMLRGRAESLPKSPAWKSSVVTFQNWPTKVPMHLYYRDSLECVEKLMSNPLFSGHLDFCPRRLYKTSEGLIRVYNEWMTGNSAWDMQACVPPGSTILGTILSSDKTNVSIMTGDTVAHPVLISLANIEANIRMKSSHHAFLLTALLPCPKFLTNDKDIRGPLENRVVHHCLDIICKPLKQAARLGQMMSDPVGNLRFCFTPLVAYIADTPEAALLAGVGGRTSHVTMASDRTFGDPLPHERRTASTTLAQLDALVAEVGSPWNLEAYVKKSKARRLNGVHLPFWRDWGLGASKKLAEPCEFLTPEPLHLWHKEFFDHDVKWCINLLGPEIDFRFSVLQPIVGFRHFGNGISELKQVTGRGHRDIERVIISIIAGAAPKECVTAIRALMDFRYLAQLPSIDDNILTKITAALKEFHDHKQHILDSGARRGKKNNRMDHFKIPKIELLHSVVPSIRCSGATYQWSADITEHAHITEVKNPAEFINNRQCNAQICRFLDRAEKRRDFDLATTIRRQGIILDDYLNEGPDAEEGGDSSTSIPEWIDELDTNEATGPSRKNADFFADATLLLTKPISVLLLPLRTFATKSIAFRLNHRADITRMAVDKVAEKFQIPDLSSALADYIASYQKDPYASCRIGGRRTLQQGVQLPFKDVRVWYSVRMQTKDGDNAVTPSPPRRLFAFPPGSQKSFPLGRYDCAIFSHDMEGPVDVPGVGLQGFSIAQIRLIIYPLDWLTPFKSPIYLTYAQRFDIIPQATQDGPRAAVPDPVTGMYILKRAIRRDGSRMGDIIPLSRYRMPVELTPRFGAKADSRLTKENSLESSTEFILNKYFHKDTFSYLLNSHNS